MRRGVKIGGLFLALLVASFPARAGAAEPSAGKTADDPEAQKAREQIREALKAGEYEKIEPSLEVLLKKSRESEAGMPVSDQVLSEQELKDRMDAAVDQGKDDLAAYYLDRIKLMNAKPNIFGWALDLTIWTIVVFLVLLFILGKFAWKPMLQGLEKREHDIHAAITDAQKAREEGQRLRDEIQAERAKIEDMRRDVIQKAQADAQRTADEITAKAKAEMQAERERLRRDMESAHDQTLQDLYAKAIDLATLVSSKVIRRQLSPDDHRRFVDEALADLRQSNGHPTPTSA